MSGTSFIHLIFFSSAYKKFQDIDPQGFSVYKKGKVSFVTVAELLKELAVNFACR